MGMTAPSPRTTATTPTDDLVDAPAMLGHTRWTLEAVEEREGEYVIRVAGTFREPRGLAVAQARATQLTARLLSDMAAQEPAGLTLSAPRPEGIGSVAATIGAARPLPPLPRVPALAVAVQARREREHLAMQYCAYVLEQLAAVLVADYALEPTQWLVSNLRRIVRTLSHPPALSLDQLAHLDARSREALRDRFLLHDADDRATMVPDGPPSMQER